MRPPFLNRTSTWACTLVHVVNAIEMSEWKFPVLAEIGQRIPGNLNGYDSRADASGGGGLVGIQFFDRVLVVDE